MGLAAEHGAARGRQMFRICRFGLVPQQLGEPFHIGLFHFALGEFPYFQRIDIRTELFAPFMVLRQDTQHVLAGVLPGMMRARPGKNPGRREFYLALGFREQTQLSGLLFQNPGEMGFVSLHEFHNAPRMQAGAEGVRFNHGTPWPSCRVQRAFGMHALEQTHIDMI